MSLKPCPFCGRAPKESVCHYDATGRMFIPLYKYTAAKRRPGEYSEYYAQCASGSCSVNPMTRHYKTKRAARAAWNRRKGENSDVL